MSHLLGRVLDFSKEKKVLSFPRHTIIKHIKRTAWSESAREVYRPSENRLSVKLLPTFADRECHLVSVTDPYGRILCFLDRSRYFSIK
jgi:hypothetical protein